ncbi:hypothetical protein UA08_05510 [Talaromyces atroroseus]|uniref:FAD/NAD(P)-binding domain-containing protein n=1 Tax=Talaromyces atroroseus TaxID=1441469 RepID=A0A225B0D9_TALAT|nr:hypothetical protein UA08_05510 [Talaromyces atroroseus]OKL59257.1 hypothetical protein UA08_05510 [Talaromyces atroroseus]
MAPRYRRVAVIGAGPSGLAAVHALAGEKTFDAIRVFDRRDHVGGLWHYDPEPDTFPATTGVPPPRTLKPPATFPDFAPAAGPDPRARSALYYNLDSNVGATTMAFTHTPFPEVNSPLSIQRFGRGNPTRPYTAIAEWIEDLFKPFLPFVSLNTTVEKVAKQGKEWILTLRKTGQVYRGKEHDYWWTETFDAVVIASGHYHVPFIPDIPGLIEASKALPERFGHSKSYRKPDKYINKRILIVGGNISATDFINDLHDIVKGKLEVAIRSRNEKLESAYSLPNVNIHTSSIRSISATNGLLLTVTFEDSTSISGLDYILFATGYRLEYPYLHPNPTTPENRVAGFYQHVFNIDDPSLTLVGQVKAALSFRIYEYQAVAIARYYAGRGAGLPSVDEQRKWEVERLKEKGPTSAFHEIAPDLEPYFNWFVDVAGKPAIGTDGYELPRWRDEFADKGLAVLGLKEKYWKDLANRKSQIAAKL